MLKKFFISLTLACYLLVSSLGTLAKPAKAEGLWYHQDPRDWYVKTFDPTNPTEIFGERYTAAQVQWVVYSVFGHMLTAITFGHPEPWICAFSGNITSSSCITGTFEVMKDVFTSLFDWFGLPFSLIVSSQNQDLYAESNTQPQFSFYKFFYENPYSGIGYILRKVDNFRIVPEAKAQESGGFGYKAGEAIQTLWTASRNIAYSLLVIVVVAMSFMIMFRVKVSPQTVITLQSALPKIIITIVLITFSYAIAGFLIDSIYIVIGLLSVMLSSSGIVDATSIELFKDLTVNYNAFVLTILYIITWLFSAITTAFSQAGSLGWGLIFMVFTVILIFIALFNGFKVWWLLIKTYVNIVLSIAVAPFQILLGAIVPNAGFGQWVRGLIANLAVYPTVGLLYVMSFFFLSQPFSESKLYDVTKLNLPFGVNFEVLGTTQAWDPPLTFGQASTYFLALMTSFVIFAIIPKTAEMIKSMIEGKPFAYGTAIGEALGPVKPVWEAGKSAAIGQAAFMIGEGFVVPRATDASPFWRGIAQWMRRNKFIPEAGQQRP